MAKKKKPIAKLKCEKCGRVNYMTGKSKEAKEKKLAFQKYCNWCRVHAVHKEGKK